MSLKVWLPLNGDLRNLGCSNPIITNSNATVNNDGKIGKCYYFNGTDARISLTSLTYTYPLSICAWIKGEKMTNTATQYIVSYNTTASGTSGHRIGFGIYGGKLSIWHGGTYTSYETTLNNDIWYHIAATVTSNGYKLYLNGEEIMNGSRTEPEISSIWFTLGARSNSDTGGVGGASYYFKGSINDVRIYDHCLSAAEVHEIAQGLIIHYKLNDPMNGIGKNYLTNLIDNTNNFKSKGCTYDYKDGTYTLTVTDVGEFQQIWNDNLITDTSNFVGKNIVVSYENITTTDSSANIRVYLRCTNSSSNTTSYIINNYATKITLPEDIVKIGILFRCDQNKNSPIGTVATFSKFKLEIGDKATIWIPPEYPYEENNLIIDSSGYVHQANLQTGTSSFTLDTAKYNSSLTTEETTCYRIQDTIFDSQHLASDFTWAGWIKRNYTTAEAKYIYKGIVYIYLGDEFDIRIGWRHRNEDGSYDSNNAWAPGKIISYNEWTHITFTFKDGIMKLYVNGEYTRMSDRSETGIYIRGYRNFYFPSNSGDSFVGNISDMRVYCTALLDKDIKLLYNVSSRIDNLGGVHSFELEEKDNNLLAGTLITSAYTNKVNPYTKYNSNGEMYFDTNKTSAGSNYISINPTNRTYYYDFDISVNAGNQFYIGFERYDANKTSRSNSATIYIYATKSTEDINHKHIFGIVDLSTDGVNPCAFVALRILNGWSGTDSGVVGVATIHSMSLSEISSIQNPKSCKNGILSTGEFKEYQKASFYKNGFVEAAEFIEI